MLEVKCIGFNNNNDWNLYKVFIYINLWQLIVLTEWVIVQELHFVSSVKVAGMTEKVRGSRMQFVLQQQADCKASGVHYSILFIEVICDDSSI